MPLLPLIRKMDGTLIKLHYPPPSLAAHRWPSPSSAPILMHTYIGISIGTGDGEGDDDKFDECYEFVGRFGSTRINDSGRRLRVYLETHQLCALTSFFPKKYYTTWTHPCSRSG